MGVKVLVIEGQGDPGSSRDREARRVELVALDRQLDRYPCHRSATRCADAAPFRCGIRIYSISISVALGNHPVFHSLLGRHPLSCSWRKMD